MDAFAEIALATSPVFSPPQSFGFDRVERQHQPASAGLVDSPHFSASTDRPSKRARSEAPFPNGASQSNSRPATSYIPSTEWSPATAARGVRDSMTEDAELLLSISRAVFDDARKPAAGLAVNGAALTAIDRETWPKGSLRGSNGTPQVRSPMHSRRHTPPRQLDSSATNGARNGIHNAYNVIPDAKGKGLEIFGLNTGAGNLADDRDAASLTKDAQAMLHFSAPSQQRIQPLNASATPKIEADPTKEDSDARGAPTATCAGCERSPNSARDDRAEETSWISCDGCNAWYHYACAGLTEREVRSVDKYSCPKCWDTHGPTTCGYADVLMN